MRTPLAANHERLALLGLTNHIFMVAALMDHLETGHVHLVADLLPVNVLVIIFGEASDVYVAQHGTGRRNLLLRDNRLVTTCLQVAEHLLLGSLLLIFVVTATGRILG